MSIVVRIGGVERSVVPRSLEFTETLNQPGSASFILHDSEGDYLPELGSPVEIEDSGTVYFRGLVDDAGIVKPTPEGSSYRRTPTRCTDYTSIAVRRTAGFREWTNQKLNDIARDIVTTFLDGEGVDLTFVPAGQGPDVEKYSTDLIYVSDALTRLCDGVGYFWRIDGTKHLRLFANSYVLAIWTATPSNGAVHRDTLTQSRNDSDYANRIWVKASNYLNEGEVQQFTGDGDDVFFTLDSPAAAVASVTVSGVPQTIGVKGLDTASVYWTQGSGSIEFALAPAAAAPIVVTYTAIRENQAEASDLDEMAARAAVEGGTGVHERVVDVSATLSKDAAQALANALLTQYKQSSWVSVFQSDTIKPTPGQIIALTGFANHENGNYIARKVRGFDRGSAASRLRFEVECVKGRPIQDAVGWFRALTGQGSGTALPVGDAGSGIPGIPNAPTNVQGVVTPVGETQYQVAISCQAPSPLGDAKSYRYFIRFYNDAGGTEIDSDWIGLGDSDDTSATFGPYGRPATPQWIRVGVQALNQWGQPSSLTASTAVYALQDLPITPATPPAQPVAGQHWGAFGRPNAANTDYRADPQGVQHVRLSCVIVEAVTDADYYELWYYEAATAPGNPSRWIYAGQRDGIGTLEGVWVPQPSTSQAWVLCCTASRYGFRVVPWAGITYEQISIAAWAAAPAPTDVVLMPFPQRTTHDGRVQRQYRIQCRINRADPNWEAVVWERRFRGSGFSDPGSGPEYDWIEQGGHQQHNLRIIDGSLPSYTLVELGNFGEDWWDYTSTQHWIELRVGCKNHALDVTYSPTVLQWSQDAGPGIDLTFVNPVKVGPEAVVTGGKFRIGKARGGVNLDFEQGSAGYSLGPGTEIGAWGEEGLGARMPANPGYDYADQTWPVVPGEQWRVSGRMRMDAGASAAVLLVMFLDVDNNLIWSSGGQDAARAVSTASQSWQTLSVTSIPAPTAAQSSTGKDAAALYMHFYAAPGSSGYCYLDRITSADVTPQISANAALAALAIQVISYGADAQGVEQYDVAVTWTAQAATAERAAIRIKQTFISDTTNPSYWPDVSPSVGKTNRGRVKKPAAAAAFSLDLYWVSVDGVPAATAFATLNGTAPAHATGTIPENQLNLSTLQEIISSSSLGPELAAVLDALQFEYVGGKWRVDALAADIIIAALAVITQTLEIVNGSGKLKLSSSQIELKVGGEGPVITGAGSSFPSITVESLGVTGSAFFGLTSFICYALSMWGDLEMTGGSTLKMLAGADITFNGLQSYRNHTHTVNVGGVDYTTGGPN